MGTFVRLLQLAALYDFDCLEWVIPRAFRDILHLLDDVIAFENFSEDDVLAIEPPSLSQRVVHYLFDKMVGLRGDGRGDEELRAVCVLARVCHAHHAGLGVLQLEVLVGKFGSVNRFPSST